MEESKKRKNFFLKTMGNSMVDVKASGETLWWLNTMPSPILGLLTLRFNGQDWLVRLGNYCCSSKRVASVDENKNSLQKIIHILSVLITWHDDDDDDDEICFWSRVKFDGIKTNEEILSYSCNTNVCIYKTLCDEQDIKNGQCF